MSRIALSSYSSSSGWVVVGNSLGWSNILTILFVLIISESVWAELSTWWSCDMCKKHYVVVFLTLLESWIDKYVFLWLCWVWKVHPISNWSSLMAALCWDALEIRKLDCLPWKLEHLACIGLQTVSYLPMPSCDTLQQCFESGSKIQLFPLVWLHYECLSLHSLWICPATGCCNPSAPCLGSFRL